MEPPKEVKNKKLRNTCDRSSKVPLTMSDLARKGKDNKEKNYVVTDKVPEDQAKSAYQPTKEFIDVTPIQI